MVSTRPGPPSAVRRPSSCRPIPGGTAVTPSSSQARSLETTSSTSSSSRPGPRPTSSTSTACSRAAAREQAVEVEEVGRGPGREEDEVEEVVSRLRAWDEDGVTAVPPGIGRQDEGRLTAEGGPGRVDTIYLDRGELVLQPLHGRRPGDPGPAEESLEDRHRVPHHAGVEADSGADHRVASGGEPDGKRRGPAGVE